MFIAKKRAVLKRLSMEKALPFGDSDPPGPEPTNKGLSERPLPSDLQPDRRSSRFARKEKNNSLVAPVEGAVQGVV